MFKKKKDKTITDMLLEKKLQEEMRKQLLQKHNIHENTTIIIEKKSKVLSVLSFLVEMIKIIFKFLLVTILCILTTIGSTVLFNTSLRDLFFQNINLIK